MRYSLTARVTPLDLQLPWITWEAIEYISEHIECTTTVFEFGSGGSTLFFSNKAGSVTAVEHDPEWYTAIQSRVQMLGCGNVSIKYAPIECHSADDNKSRDYVNAVTSNKWDIVLVDGYNDYGRFRESCFDASLQYVRPGGMIIVDDIWMFPELEEKARKMGGIVFTGVGPCRLGVSSTMILRVPSASGVIHL